MDKAYDCGELSRKRKICIIALSTRLGDHHGRGNERLGLRVGWRRDRSEAEKSQDPLLEELMGSFPQVLFC